ncbi:MAG: type I restriction endonuclease subunit R [Nitrospirota bacterium]|nr:type I restriction endonuclease subunit R [Nitrospirota bacterium]
MTAFTESVVEDAALAWLEALGYAVLHGPDIAAGGLAAERSDPNYRDVVLERRLRQALVQLNPDLPTEALEDAYRKLTRSDAPSLVERNRAVHRMLIEGIPVEYLQPSPQPSPKRGAPSSRSPLPLGEGSRGEGLRRWGIVRVIDFDDPSANDWLAVNQFTVAEGQHIRRPDVVLFVNGLPLAVIELKNPADENATIWGAYQQLQTYQAQIPSLFATNAALIVSDGVQARIGSLGAGREWFKPWRTITEKEDYASPLPSPRPDGHPSPIGRGDGGEGQKQFKSELEVLLLGVFEKRRFLYFVRHFIVFEDEGAGKLTKKMAGYHQFHAVNVAVEETLRAARRAAEHRAADVLGQYKAGHQPGGEPGDRRVGVVWHTQGSGKSLTMAFYAGRVILHPAMENPTIVVLTDRNDLDDQLFGTFARCHDLLRQSPVQAADRADLREKLKVVSGGVVFTTIQKFMPPSAAPSPQPSPSGRGGSEAEGEGDWRMPVLSDRRNVVVIADEAHRSQYDFIDGFARHMRDALPNASFIGFTGTPIEKTDANTCAVFGDYISVYDIQRAVVDGATVPIYYESRLAKLEIKDSERPKIDPKFEEVTEGEEVERKEKLKSRWAQLEAVVGSDNRIKLIARDLVNHFENRLSTMDGKAMVVCMSRRICVELYREIAALRPQWHGDTDDLGSMKVIMTGSASDPMEWQGHIRNKKRREDMALRFRAPKDPFQIVIVRDMWLTGFDAPSLHTMYVDKPMRGHGLMQAIARVNRVFKDKPGGLVVDYLGLADELKKALATYTESGGTGKTAIDQAEAVAVMLEKYEICQGLFGSYTTPAGMVRGFDWSRWITGKPQERLSVLPAAQEHILAQQDGKARLLRAVTDLSQAFALAVPHEETFRVRDDVGFFQAVRSVLAKNTPGEQKTDEELDHAIRQIISKAVASDEVVDIFAAAGLKKPDLSILSDEFLAEVRGMPQRNLAVELLRKLLAGEIKVRSKRNVVQARSFADLLEQAIKKYQNRAIETAQVIEELIGLAKHMRSAHTRGETLGLTEDELAFYDALETNDSAVKVLGEPTLTKIARELAEMVKKNVTIDWTVRENVRAQLRVLVKRILRKYGYPPDKQEKATQTVLEQAEVLCAEVAA